MDRRDIIGGISGLAIAAFVFAQSLSLGSGTFSSPGPGFILFLTSSALGMLSMILIMTRVIKREEKIRIKDLWKGLNWVRAVLAFIALILYAALLPKTGYLLTTPGLMFLLFYAGRVRLWKALTYALLTTIVSFVIFRTFLHVPFPRGILGV